MTDIKNSAVDPQQVQQWTERLTNPDPAAQRQAVSEMSRTAVRTRGAMRTRGAVRTAAQTAVSTPLEGALRDLLAHAAAPLRREIAFTLGGLGGEASVRSLVHLATDDPDPQVRTEAVSALGKIGGAEATAFLLKAAERDASESVRAEAVSALGNLLAAAKINEETTEISTTLHRIAQNELSSYVREQAMRLIRNM